jgi:hypothetical protein
VREAAVREVREYHERTKHSFESVRRSGRMLDWSSFPRPFKEYVGLAPEPVGFVNSISLQADSIWMILHSTRSGAA